MRRSLHAAVLAAAIAFVAVPAALAQQSGPTASQLVIRTFKGGGAVPDETIRIPLNAVRIAARLIPERFRKEMEAEGISVEEIGRLAREGAEVGDLAIIESAGGAERTVVRFE